MAFGPPLIPLSQVGFLFFYLLFILDFSLAGWYPANVYAFCATLPTRSTPPFNSKNI